MSEFVGSTEKISTLAKVGDTVKITAIDVISEQLYPELLGMEVVVTGIDIDGDLVFKYDKPAPKSSSLARLDKTHLIMSVLEGWQWELTK